MQKNNLLLSLALCIFPLSLNAQSALGEGGKIVNVRKHTAQDLAKWGIPGANYSGITYLGGNEYAVVNDKDEFDGFYIFTIDLDSVTGKVRDVRRGIMLNDYKPEGQQARDAEGVAYVPFRKSVFISAESDQRVVEHSLEGRLTGKELSVPKEMDINAIYGNYGFEALAYSKSDNRLWTVTENTLKADGKMCVAGDKEGAMLRLQSFDANTLQPSAQYAYKMDAPKAKAPRKHYAYGVSAICALEDGSLLVLEREFYVAKRYIGSFVNHKIYRVCPHEDTTVSFTTDLSKLAPSNFMHKEFVCSFKTRLNLTKRNLANFEGMCLGPRLSDGKQSLILISDSQNNYGNKMFRLKDYVKVMTLK